MRMPQKTHNLNNPDVYIYIYIYSPRHRTLSRDTRLPEYFLDGVEAKPRGTPPSNAVTAFTYVTPNFDTASGMARKCFAQRPFILIEEAENIGTNP